MTPPHIIKKILKEPKKIFARLHYYIENIHTIIIIFSPYVFYFFAFFYIYFFLFSFFFFFFCCFQGHSTNFVTWIEIPSREKTIFRSSLVSETNAQIKFCDQDYWIKAGVACFCALRY